MAKVTGPFMSVDASGTFGGLLTASIWKGRNYIRQHVKPTTSQAAQSVAAREAFAAAVSSWQGQYSEIKDSWNEAARDVYPPISGFNYYVSQYILQGGVPEIPETAPRKSKTLHG